MRIFYDIFFLLFAVFYVPVMAVKGKFHAGFSQKLGRVPNEILSAVKPVWIHAVSVGEALVAARLCQALKDAMPSVKVVISTTTRTGNEMARKNAVRADGIFYYPIDIRSVVRKVLKAVDPSAYVIIETELWPNMLEEASAMGIPVILANGRISDRSFAGYKKLGFITRKMLSCFSTLCVQTPRDAGKLRELGCGTHKIRVTGNIKFDGAISSVKDPEVEKTERFFASGKKVIVAGSTHFPEESGIIDEFVRFSGASRGMKLIIAPRHVERKEAIKVYVESSGLKCCFFSELSGEKCHEMSSADVMIVDTIGHLKDLYSLADVVFIGGSMVKKGGQNPIEAARWGKAIVFGPDMSNFSEVARDFVGGGAALVANDFKRLGGIIEDLMANDAKRLKMGKASGEVIEKNSGAVDRTVEAILEKVKYR